MTDDLRTGLARAICEAQHIAPDALVMHGFKTMTALESRLPAADATMAVFTKHMQSDAMVERVAELAVPEPTHLYDGRHAADIQEFKNATAIDRLAFISQYRRGITAIGEHHG